VAIVVGLVAAAAERAGQEIADRREAEIISVPTKMEIHRFWLFSLLPVRNMSRIFLALAR
jgi:hypothetical protein